MLCPRYRIGKSVAAALYETARDAARKVDRPPLLPCVLWPPLSHVPCPATQRQHHKAAHSNPLFQYAPRSVSTSGEASRRRAVDARAADVEGARPPSGAAAQHTTTPERASSTTNITDACVMLGLYEDVLMAEGRSNGGRRGRANLKLVCVNSYQQKLKDDCVKVQRDVNIYHILFLRRLRSVLCNCNHAWLQHI